MTSIKAAPRTISYAWHAWVTVPGQGRAFAHGTITVPLDYRWARVQREVGAWLGAQGVTGRLADISLIIAPQA